MSFYFQAEDGIRNLVRSRGLGDVYKRQDVGTNAEIVLGSKHRLLACSSPTGPAFEGAQISSCLLYTSDAADERSSVDLGGRRIIKKKPQLSHAQRPDT